MPAIMHAPKAVKEELQRGLAWHEEGQSGDGLKPETVAWARRLAEGEAITQDKAVKMRAWLARHASDKEGEGFRPGEPGYPSPGRVAWALWGGDPAVPWSEKVVTYFEENMKKRHPMDALYEAPEFPVPMTAADLTPVLQATMPPEMQAEFVTAWNLTTQPLPAGLGMDDDRAFWFVMDLLCYEQNWQRKPDGSYARLTVEDGTVAKAGRVFSAANEAKLREMRATLDAMLASMEEMPDAEPTEKGATLRLQMTQIAKADPDKMQVFGFAYVALTADGTQIVDHSGEFISKAELETACYKGFGVIFGGEDHTKAPLAKTIELAFIDHAKLAAMGAEPKDAPQAAIWIGLQLTDKALWEAVKDGKKAFSIGGRALRAE